MADFVTNFRNSSQNSKIWSQKFTRWFFKGIFATFDYEYN